MNPLTVLNDDIFLVSYPKSGNTWMRFLISILYFGKKADWSSINMMIPDIYQYSDKELLDKELLNFPSPRFLKSHEHYDVRYRKVIYIVRDVRDVVISYYHYLLKTKEIDEISFDNFFEKFLLGTVAPGLWDRHVLGWIDNKDKIDEGFLLLKYEDLKSDICFYA